MEIREGTVADLDLLTQVRLEFLAERTDTPHDEVVAQLAAPTREYFAGRFAADRLWCWFAEEVEGWAGAVAFVVNDIPPRPGELRTREAHVLNMYVAPDRRRGGIGRRLMEAGIAASAARGVRLVVLHATEDGRPLYERLGFLPKPDWMELDVPAPG